MATAIFSLTKGAWISVPPKDGRRSRERKRVVGRAILAVLASAVMGRSEDFPRPGLGMNTPVLRDNIDHEAFKEWVDGKERTPDGRGAKEGPEWVIWAFSKEHPGHNGLIFGAEKVPGVRHVRIGFKAPVAVGSVLTRGDVRLSVLRTDAGYPGDLGDDSQWIAGQRLVDGGITRKQAGKDGCVFWVYPPGTTTRALRFSHDAVPTDESYEGWLGCAALLRERLINLAPLALAAGKSNNRHADRIINGMSDGWTCWENTNAKAEELADRPVVSRQSPEWLQLTWQGPVSLDGLITIWTGFGEADIQAYSGPADLHPRDASDADWTTVSSPSGFESGYPVTLWPNVFRFERRVTTRAIRVRIAAVTPAGHPHVRSKPANGKRVWLGELMAVQNIGDGALKAPTPGVDRDAVPHPPIPVRFSLPEAGYVTLVVEKPDGARIRNLVSETWFPAGDNVAWWDGTDDLGRDIDAAKHGLYNIPARFVDSGTYRVRGLWHKGIKASYEFSVYTSGNPPWSTPDHTGAWLANHSPPSAAVFVPASRSPTRDPAIFLGCFVTEGPDGMAWVDLEGRKRGGMKWIGGNWTAAPYLGADVGPNADPGTAAYAASVWETAKNSGIHELRISALEVQDSDRLKVRTVMAERLDRWDEKAGTTVKERDRMLIMRGIAAFDGVLACSLNALNRVLFVDAASGKSTRDIPVSDPRGLAYDREGRLLVLSGNRLLGLMRGESAGLTAGTNLVVSAGLEDPFAVALDSENNIYISDHGNSHQVKVFSPEGKLLRCIGHPGRPGAGRYDSLHMNHPAGLAIDSRNRLWVAEHDFLPKRVGVWTLDGRLLNAFYGPAKYGGGGMLDAHDKSRFYYADEGRGTLEFRLDWEDGCADLAAVLYRRTPETMELAFRSGAPEAALYRGGKRYFSNCYNSNPTGGHNTGFLFIERDGVAYPAAGMGMANEWPLLRKNPFRALWPEGSDPDGDKWRNDGVNQALFIWSDANDDGHAQQNEVRLHHTPARGVTIMDDLSFCIAHVGGKAMRLNPVDFSLSGVPVYDFSEAVVLVEGVERPMSSGGCQVLADDSDESIITLGVEPFHSHSICGSKGGKSVWSYPSPWPGLHASHHAAKPHRAGQLIGTTRLLGSFVHPHGSEVGPLWAVNGNMGNLYLFTRDGLFVATVFEDVRQGKLWKMTVAQRGMGLDGISLHDENFWPSISQTPEGQVYLVDGSYSSLVRLDGLESLRPVLPIVVQVAPEDLAESQEYVVEMEMRRQRTFGRGTLKAAVHGEAPVVDGNLAEWVNADWVDIDTRGAGANFNSDAKPYNIRGALAVSGDRLYAAWDTHERNLLVNSGELTNALFKTGGALDLMLGVDPRADPKRRNPVAGDVRLLITRVKDEVRAILYRQVVPGTSEENRIPFSSPWRTIMFDEVQDVSDEIKLVGSREGCYEVSVPTALLGLQPKGGVRIRGDIGILRGNGTETTARSYWGNKATGITSDVPSEAMLTPHLWGTIEWEVGDDDS